MDAVEAERAPSAGHGPLPVRRARQMMVGAKLPAQVEGLDLRCPTADERQQRFGPRGVAEGEADPETQVGRLQSVEHLGGLSRGRRNRLFDGERADARLAQLGGLILRSLGHHERVATHEQVAFVVGPQDLQGERAYVVPPHNARRVAPREHDADAFDRQQRRQITVETEA